MGAHGGVAIVGGGIAGMAAAWELSRAGGFEVTVLEAGDTPGGKIAAAEVGGVTVDTGPDSFLARGTAAAALAGELGLELTAPRAYGAFVWSRGRLRRLPDGLLLGVPGRLLPLARSGIVSPLGVARAAADLVLPSTPHDDDFSVEDGLVPRLGREVYERMVEPLLGGVHAAPGSALSLPEVAPQVAGVLTSSRSLLMALRTMPGPSPGSPVFLCPYGGMHSLASRLAAALLAKGVTLRTSTAVNGLKRTGHGFAMGMAGGSAGDDQTMGMAGGTAGDDQTMGTAGGTAGDDQTMVSDRVILALGAPAAGALLKPIAPALARELASIPYTSVGVVTFAFPVGTVPASLPGSGYLVPRREGWLTTAATWLSVKWEHYRNAGPCLVRVSVGRAGDERFTQMDDAEVARQAHAELSVAMATLGVALPAAPEDYVVTRWMTALPRFAVGHRRTLARIQEAASTEPRLTLAGAYLNGVGVPACVESGIAAASAVSAPLERS